ncbi:hypothetical protein FHR20_000555 [Sphingomonas leidyi]|uniref:Right handed beta helix domain-containing protein n=1 Tax=Sphingomonas leidyi TaxID=68569 RepID=A0A7X5UWL0_9SPHN|nr:hypothetical protein [Sphingomonas leidyi]NIJ63624.1 hypothetical protein [Sphingomonas leidyi]
MLSLSPATFGALGDGRTIDTDALAEALSAARGASGAVLLDAGKVYKTGDLKIPRGTVLIFSPGARLAPARPGARLTIDGRIESIGFDRIFEDGWTFYKSEPDILDGFPDVPLEWFGGLASWTERRDALPAFRYALAFCKAMRCRAILLGNGSYFVSDTIRIDGTVGIKGAGMESTFLIRRGGAPNAATIQLVGVRDDAVGNLEYSGFSLLPLEREGVGTGIAADWFAHVRLSEVEFRNLATGLDLVDGAYSWQILGCRFLNNRTHVALGPNANNLIVAHCQLMHGETGIDCKGASNSISIGAETNFEALTGQPIRWRGNGTTLFRFSITGCRFEKCVGAIGYGGGNARALAFSFDQGFVENVNGTTSHFFDLTNCESAVVSRSYFQRCNAALVNAPRSASQVVICDNVLRDIPQINSASKSGGFGEEEGFSRCRAYNCGGVKGSA